MAVICPTVTATDSLEFDRQTSLITKFAHRIHIDLMDGDFAPTKSPGLDHVWWPEGVEADLHIMYRRPQDHFEQIVALKPNLVIIPAESDISPDEWLDFRSILASNNIKLGVALLSDTSPQSARGQIIHSDHCLIFSGNLGYHGGVTNLNLLNKISDIKSYNPASEIGWDGGVNLENANILSSSGIQVLNVGSGVHHDKTGLSPEQVYDKLMVEVDTRNKG